MRARNPELRSCRCPRTRSTACAALPRRRAFSPLSANWTWRLAQALESSSARCAESAKSRTEIRAKALECVLDDGAASIVQSMAETLGDALSACGRVVG